jgi:hypothetical protein
MEILYGLNHGRGEVLIETLKIVEFWNMRLDKKDPKKPLYENDILWTTDWRMVNVVDTKPFTDMTVAFITFELINPNEPLIAS